jgi:hypothetical protein
MTSYLLSEADRALLRRLYDADKARQGGSGAGGRTMGRPNTVYDEVQGPEVYVAKSPVGGIPALIPVIGTAPGFDQPGMADCDIYSITGADSTPQLQLVNFQKRIYNLNSAGIPGSTWVGVARDKFGLWLVVLATATATNLKTDYSDGTGVINPTTELAFNISDFVLTGAGGKQSVQTNGWTGTFTMTCVSDVVCNGSTLTKTVKTFSDTSQDGLRTVAPTFS